MVAEDKESIPIYKKSGSVFTLPAKNGQRRSPVEGEGNCRALLYEKIILLALLNRFLNLMALVYHSYLMIVWITYELFVNF